MKKIIIILAVFLTAFFANVNSAYSQPSSGCSPCLEPMASGTYKLLAVINACPVTITINWRACDSTNLEMDIVSIEGNTFTPCDFSGHTNKEFLMENAIKRALLNYYSIFGIWASFNPNPSIKVITPTCLKRTTSGSVRTFELCDTSYCCKTYEMDVPGYINNITGTSSGTYTCVGLLGEDCDNICDAMGNVEEGTLYERPCLNECSNNWEGNYNTTTNISGCSATIQYAKRLNCDDELELRIESVEYSNSCTVNLDDVLSQSIRKVIAIEGLTVVPPSPTDIYVNINGCWEINSFPDKNFATACPDTGCCLVKFTIQEGFQMGKIIVVPNGIDIIDGDDHDYCQFSPNACEFVCGSDYFNVPTNTNLKQINNSNTNELNLLKVTSFVTVIPNPTNKESKIKFDSNINGKIELIIFNNIGQEMFRINGNKEHYGFETRINVSNYNKGLYHIKVNVDGQNIRNSSFIVE